MGLFDRLRGDDAPRVAFFGIDGVPYSLLADHFDEFENFAALAEDGAAGPIDSIVPPESSACWPSLTTGKNPGETGVYGFQDREVGSYDTYVPMGRDVQADRVWDIATEEGRDATVMNVPVTFPPQRNVQRMVSGFLSPGIEKAAYPDELAEYLEGIDYKIDANAKLGHDEDKSAFIENAHETLDARYEAFSNYIEQDDWDLFFGVFMTTDRINHFLFEHYEKEGEYKEEFLDFYRKLDDYIGQLREQLDDDTTMVVASDHGFTTLENEVHCNAWLEENGWLDFEDDDHEELGDISEDTTAYSLIPGRFYINLEGREPRGSVPESEYEDKRDQLKSALESLEGPDGR
ncbi:MAG TPA: alkaline phosphatase family protein, partial [Natronoarchaeum rubrum]|nr:alkaline phosphatase family protein [Natronoarchaeum rubrum]